MLRSTTINPPKAAAEPVFEVYYGAQLLRKSGDAPTGVPLVDATFDNLRRVDSFVRRELGLSGWDDKNGPLRAQLKTDLGRNAFFDTSTATILLGQRDRANLATSSYGFSATIMGHEIAHGVEVALGKAWPKTVEEIVVDESWADVLATGVDDRDWVLGDEIPGGAPLPGSDPRDLANPPYRRLQDIPAGQTQHYSQLMSYAAVIVSEAIGKHAMRALWFEGMKRTPSVLGEHAMRVFADAVVRAATELHGAGSPAVAAVTRAYKTIGIY